MKSEIKVTEKGVAKLIEVTGVKSVTLIQPDHFTAGDDPEEGYIMEFVAELENGQLVVLTLMSEKVLPAHVSPMGRTSEDIVAEANGTPLPTGAGIAEKLVKLMTESDSEELEIPEDVWDKKGPSLQ